MLVDIYKLTGAAMLNVFLQFFHEKPLIAWGLTIFILILIIIAISIASSDQEPGCLFGMLFFIIGIPLLFWLIAPLIIWIRLPKNAPPISQPNPASQPSLDTTPSIYITETGSRTETIGTERIPMPNCGNPNSYEYIANVSHQVENKIIIDGQLGVELSSIITIKLQTKYGIETSNVRIETRSIKLFASPNTSVDYFVTWRYIWYEGFITVQRGDQQEIHPYKINRIDFVPENPVSQICEP